MFSYFDQIPRSFFLLEVYIFQNIIHKIQDTRQNKAFPILFPFIFFSIHHILLKKWWYKLYSVESERNCFALIWSGILSKHL